MVLIRRNDILFPELSYKIIGSAFDVFNSLGSGHSEKYYQRALAIAFSNNNIKFQEQVFCPLRFANKIIGKNFIDFVVEDKIVVEIKKNEKFSKNRIDQILGYLKTSGLKLGILINFGKEGVLFRRIVNLV